MKRVTFSHLLAASIALAGCSGNSGGEDERGEPTPGGSRAGSGAVPTNTKPSGNFGNSNTTTVNMSPPTMMEPTAPMTGMTSKIEPVSIDQCLPQNPAGLSEADATKLMAGSGDPGAIRLLYPYDGTVFPRGLLAPLLMWDGGDAEFVYVHIKATRFEYKGCLKPSAAGQLTIPEDVWKTAGEKTMGGNDPFSVELTLMNGGTVTGPVSEQIVIAQASLKGSIFYNSYSSQLPGGENTGLFPGSGMGQGGSVLRIPPGGTVERFTASECNGCHSVSANGSRLLASTAGNGGLSFALDPTTQPNPPSMAAGPRGGYGALYPDGTIYLSTSSIIDVARSSLTQSFDAPTDATLYETDTGTVIPSTGIPTGALMPMFSPDGSLLVFNDNAAGEAHGVALMSFDFATKTASDYKVLYMDTETRPAWPFVLPDNNGVVFTRTNGADFSGEGAGLAAGAAANVTGATEAPKSDMYIADVKTGTLTILAKAMGYATPDDAAAGTAYLPFGAEELHMNYFPTLSPVAAGGYFWLLFDSVRHYGNQGLQRQLWGAAITIAADGSYSADLSHPAFYLPGQEFGTGNHRAFAALEPCKQDGNDCTSGVDCCGGFCFVPESTDVEFGTEPTGMCTHDVPKCSKTNEHCATSADCCPPEMGEPANLCIAGFCATPPPGPD
jgi:hypothetical protein